MTATPTRVGIFEYRRADGSTVRELRAPEEVFAPDSLASLEDVAVTIGHPPGGYKPAAFASVATGHVRAGTVRADEAAGVVRAGMAIARADAQALAASKPMLSCGYDMVPDPTPGVWQGQPYDVRQTRIRYDHVALLRDGIERPRGGAVCRLDSDGEEITDEVRADAASLPKETPMKLTIGGKTYESEAEAQAAVTALEARADAMSAQVKTLTEAQARHDAEAAPP